TFSEVMDAVINSIGGWYAFDATGVLRMGRLEAPSGSPVCTLGDEDILGTFERRPARDGDIPCWSYTVRHSRLWTVQGSDLAGGVSAARRAILANEYRAEVATDAAVKTQYLLAAEEVDDTLLTDASAAATEAARLLALHKVRRDFFDVTVPAQVLTENGLELMDVIEVVNARFGLSSGRLFRLLGINYELAGDRVTLTLWG
ncbi:MAG: hypothetical protein IT546_14360, partial [Caulobacteraceae bacterium]|nr:hypothetical protein [Caulobacteraceae bacterium]